MRDLSSKLSMDPNEVVHFDFIGSRKAVVSRYLATGGMASCDLACEAFAHAGPVAPGDGPFVSTRERVR